ncbi:MAG: transcriptional regulator [Acidobacteria bacterium]|nr:MAG: transcriptional regulator [Acidobacteriota bacterium]
MPQETMSRSSPHLHSFERASRLIGDHWTLLIVRELTLNHSLSFTELHVALRGISTNILSHRLHQLVSQQLLTVNQCRADGRKQFYSLTPIGAGLRPVICSIDHWGREYLGAIASIRR